MALTITVRADSSQAIPELQRVGAQVSRLETTTQQSLQRMEQQTRQSSQQMTRSFQGISTAITRVVGALAAIAGGVTIGGLVRGAIDTAASFEQLDTQLRFVVGSMEAFQQARQFIIQFTTQTPFQLGEVTKGFIDLARRGFEVERTLKAVGDAASLAQFPTQAFEGIIFALGQVADKGKLTAEELQRQLANFGVPVARVLEELQRLGADVSKGIGEAGVSAKQGIEAVLVVLETNFRDAMLATAGNWKTLVSNLVDTWSVFQDFVVRGPLLDFLKGLTSLLINELTRAIKEDEAAFRAFGARAVDAVKAVIIAAAQLTDTVLLMAPAITSVGNLLTSLVGGIGDFFKQTKRDIEGLKAVAEEVAKSATGEAPGGAELLRRIQERFTALREGKGAVSDIIDVPPDVEARARKALENAEAEATRLNQRREEVLSANEKRLAQLGPRRLAETVAGDAGGGRGRSAAVERARAEEEILEASLKRQTDLTKQAFDAQRQVSDQNLLARLEREPKAYAEIQQAAEDARKTIAIEEARALEQLTIDLEGRRLQATLQRLDAERAAARKPGDVAKVEADRVEAIADSEARIQAARTRTSQVEQGLSKKSLDEALKDAQAAAQARSRVTEAELEGRQQVISAEKGLIQAQVEGRVLTEAQGLEQIKALQQEEFDNAIRLINERTAAEKQAIDDRLGQTEEAALAKQEIDRRAVSAERTVRINQQQEQQDLLNTQLASYERFAERVENFLNDVVTNFLNGTLNALDLFKQLLIRTLANIVSSVLAPFVTAISASIVGGIGEAIGGSFGQSLLGSVGLSGGAGVLGTATTVAGGAGLLNQLGLLGPIKAVTGIVANAFSFLGDLVLSGAQEISRVVNSVVFPGVENIGTSITTLSEALSLFGGIAGIGGGIFAALTAETVPGAIGGGLGAAASLTSLISTLGFLPAVLGPIGLALGALLPILGSFLGGLGAPKGPRLAIGGLGGVGISAGPGGLALTGDLTSQVLRAERVSGEQEIQAALEANLTQMIRGLVAVINEVAIDPAALQQPAQEALDTALRQALVLNSSSRENMTRDIEEQLRTVVVQIGTFFLAPMLDAFRQLDDADLNTQIQRLPVAVGQLATVLKELNEAFASAQNAENADVTRVFGEIQDRLNTFRTQLIEQTTRLAQGIVDAVVQASQETLQTILTRSLEIQALSLPGAFTQPLQALGSLTGARSQLEAVGLDAGALTEQINRLSGQIIESAFEVMGQALSRSADDFAQSLSVILAIPPAITALNPALQRIQALAQAFASVVGPLTQSIAQLEATLTPLETQLTQTTDRMNTLRQSIAEAGDDIAVALPLYEALRQAILREAELRSQQIQEELALQRETIQAQQEIIQAQTQVAEQAEALVTSLEAQVRGGLSPTRQAEAIRGEIAGLQAELATQTGAEALQTTTEIQALLTELGQLGETNDNLALIAEAQAGLEALVPIAEQQQLVAEQAITVAEAQLIAMTDTADAVEALRIVEEQAQAALRQVQEQALAQLQGLNAQLQALFLSNQAIQESLHLPVPVVIVPQAAQQGGLIALAHGGMVPALLEPGEAVMAPMNTRQLRAAQQFNDAFPRFAAGGFIIPGSGSGDTVPALVQPGSFVMNRRAVGALQGGQRFQSGGTVQAASGGTVVNISLTINLPNATMRDDRDVKKLADELARHTERIIRSRLP